MENARHPGPWGLALSPGVGAASRHPERVNGGSCPLAFRTLTIFPRLLYRIRDFEYRSTSLLIHDRTTYITCSCAVGADVEIYAAAWHSFKRIESISIDPLLRRNFPLSFHSRLRGFGLKAFTLVRCGSKFKRRVTTDITMCVTSELTMCVAVSMAILGPPS
ncbi:hypothetical protein EVAR_100249_1 [Eumeta japonica]|uniref:Uncharacterized protein n=1 Tax=Eumeta variegata TaxID=151549 RepID=A0A4C2ABD0_EUMVA|nr:hypothetical protein EVAR_100249_1 [Eumeta japonica]